METIRRMQLRQQLNIYFYILNFYIYLNNSRFFIESISILYWISNKCSSENLANKLEENVIYCTFSV